MSTDANLQRAREQVLATLRRESPRPRVKSFFDEATNTASHVVHDPEMRRAAVVDSVLDFDQPSGRTRTRSARTRTHACRPGLRRGRCRARGRYAIHA
jgi:hypothetical protein